MDKQLLTYEDSKPTKEQHTSPCSDCPFSRKSIPGWLAGNTPEEWVAMAHWETRFECHTRHITANGQAHQCAGSAIYRANVCKLPRSLETLQLPPNRVKVFSSPKEFLEHHNHE